MIEDIRDYHPINNCLATSGQPTPEQFSAIARAGYRAVIDLAVSSSTNALENEGAIVTDLGMVYVNIPVVWDSPNLEDVKLFFKIMHSLSGPKGLAKQRGLGLCPSIATASRSFASDRVWVHCAKNMRVSCFIYLWQKHILQLPEAEARYPMEQIWQPTGVWQELIEQVETSSNNKYTSP